MFSQIEYRYRPSWRRRSFRKLLWYIALTVLLTATAMGAGLFFGVWMGWLT